VPPGAGDFSWLVILDLGLGHEGARLRAVAVVLRHVSEMVPVANTIPPFKVVHGKPTFLNESVVYKNHRSPKVVDVRSKSPHGEGTDGGAIWVV
jgi:hypothetical protein